jgi:hypothetical protein
MADVTYLEEQKAFSPEAIEGATGIPVSAVLASPQQAQIITTPEPLDEKQLSILDTYMKDLGYKRNTP